jgi:hypothetical protein
VFLSIFDFSALAILHCFIVDEDFGGSSRTPESLKSFLDLNDQKNKKGDKKDDKKEDKIEDKENPKK